MQAYRPWASLVRRFGTAAQALLGKGILAIVLLGGTSTGALAQVTFGAGAGGSIPDAGSVNFTLNVPDEITINDLNIQLAGLNHAAANDVTITLTSPAGTTVQLFSAIGTPGDSFGGSYTLDDEAGTSISAAPIVVSDLASGTYSPQTANALAGFDGEDARGTWTLSVTDGGVNFTGNLSSWSLQIDSVSLLPSVPPGSVIVGGVVITRGVIIGLIASEALISVGRKHAGPPTGLEGLPLFRRFLPAQTGPSAIEQSPAVRVANAFAGEEPAPTPQPGDWPIEERLFDVWSRVGGSLGSRGNNDSTTIVGSAGGHYQLTPDVLTGIMVQGDYVTSSDDTTGGGVDGVGFLLGPYFSARLFDQPIALSAGALWGRSFNEYSPTGTFSDTFDTTRFLLSANLSGTATYGAWTVTPAASLSYLNETQHAFTDSLANILPEQTIVLGEASVGPTVTYTLQSESGMLVQPSLGIDGIWTYRNSASTSGNLRAKLNAGLSLSGQGGWTLQANAHLDGIGQADYVSGGGNVTLVWPFH